MGRERGLGSGDREGDAETATGSVRTGPWPLWLKRVPPPQTGDDDVASVRGGAQG